MRGVDALAQDPAALADLCRTHLAEVLNKMPAEVSSTLTASASAAASAAALDDLPRLDQSEDLLALLRDAEATLLARLNPASRTEVA